MAGLSPNLRLVEPEPEISGLEDADVVLEAGEGDGVETDDKGNILKIEHPDGSISISVGGTLGNTRKTGPKEWFDNLVDDVSESELNRVAEDLLRGIQDDLDSRKDWIEDRATGIKLLGLKLEMPGLTGSSDSAPVEGMSKVRHPLLLEACLRFQANARSELLPTDGPAKIRNDDNNADLREDQVANAFERDFNHFLTVTATEFVPDTDRMLLSVGFGGISFKKPYFCPLRNRPVSEMIDANDLIVNNAATDLSNAARVTHRTYMKPSTVRRMQIIGAYRDIELSQANLPNLDAVQREEKDQQGIELTAMRPEDRNREIYECYCELDLMGFEHKHKGKPSGLEIPYRVTIDVSSRQVLAIVRNYDEDTQALPVARVNFVPYVFIPGFGFYGIGLLHILGNTTNALTAAWRELLDAGMFSNFPGFLIADTGARQNTNVFRVPPGGGALVKTNGLPIGQAIMPLPYKEPSGALMTLVESIATTGQRLGGASELQVGEGKADAPVGTTLALIEQATKIQNSVHKRLHAAQALELQLIARTFREHPESFWERNRKPAKQWDEATFLEALDNYDLVPQSDPNTASHSQRLMKVMGVMQLSQASPNLYDPIAVHMAALQAMGWSNPQQFMAPPEVQGKTPPIIQQGIVKAMNETKEADARMMDTQIRARESEAKIAQMQREVPDGGPDPSELAIKQQEADTRAKIADFQQQRAAVDDENRDKDRDSEMKLEQMRIQIEQMRDQRQREHEMADQEQQRQAEHAMQEKKLAADREQHFTGLAVDHAKHQAGLGVQRANALTQAQTAKQRPAPKKGN